VHYWGSASGSAGDLERALALLAEAERVYVRDVVPDIGPVA
jgi:hypothetical protein